MSELEFNVSLSVEVSVLIAPVGGPNLCGFCLSTELLQEQT